jgi:hypothetical protein
MNQYEDYDYAAMQEAEAILNGTIPSTPETYAMVEQWYGKADSVEHSPAKVKAPVRARRNNAMRTVRVGNVSGIRASV